MPSDQWLKEQLVESYRVEAAALFEVNQAGRSAAERTATLLFTLAGFAVAAGVAAKSDVVAVPLAPLAPLLLSYMFQQYADVSVTGAARYFLETRISNELEGNLPLSYEHRVARIRQSGNLSYSFTFFKVLVGVVVLAVVATGIAVACERLGALLALACFVSTGLSLLSAGWSFCAMLKSYPAARKQLASLEQQ